MPLTTRHTPPPTTLRRGQPRLINASEGLTLQVLQGRLWVTCPNDPCDHFLPAGSHMRLTQDWVLVEADHAVGGQPGGDTCFALVPTPAPVSNGTSAPGVVGGYLSTVMGHVGKACKAFLSIKTGRSAFPS